MSGTTSSVSVDTDTQEYGLRIVNPDNDDALLDIISIHGLRGHREATWTATGAQTCWPEQYLSKDLPESRIGVYGYDADVVGLWGPVSLATIDGHSQNFLAEIARLRDKTKTSTRPITFVAHSLGGIVCQNALGRSADIYTKRVIDKTRGIIFMGSRHCGSDQSRWAAVIGKLLRYCAQVNGKPLDILQPHSDDMLRIRRGFQQMLDKHEKDHAAKDHAAMIIACFYEELPMGTFGVIVPEDSATLDRYPSMSVHANHVNMTKFSSQNDHGYQKILAELQRIIENVRAEKQSSSSTSTSEGQNGPAASHDRANAGQQGGVANTFSGTFNSGGGRMIQGGQFNSSGSMSF